MIEINITIMVRNNLKETPYTLDIITKTFNTKKEVLSYLRGRYNGKLPKGRRKVYIDDNNGISHEIGFIHSYWVDGSNRKWFYTDWITFHEVILKRLSYHDIKKKS